MVGDLRGGGDKCRLAWCWWQCWGGRREDAGTGVVGGVMVIILSLVLANGA